MKQIVFPEFGDESKLAGVDAVFDRLGFASFDESYPLCAEEGYWLATE